MTNQEINIAVAEACGWKWYRRPATGPWAKKPHRSLYHPELMKPIELPLADMTERECNYMFMEREGMIPNYAGDLNAMHEAEKTLNFPEAYASRLGPILMRDFCANGMDGTTAWHFAFAHATARQRCEAFLRTIGKWKE